MDYPVYPAPLSQERQLELVRAAQAGDQAARRLLVQTNMRLVSRLAWGKVKRYGVEVEDLHNAGAFGLSLGIDHFDLTNPVHFTTYAQWWVREEMDRAVMEGLGTNRSSGHRMSLIKGMIPLVRAGHSPAAAAEVVAPEVAAQVGRQVRPSTLHQLYVRFNSRHITSSMQDVVGEGGLERGDIMPARDVPADEAIAAAERAAHVQRALGAFRAGLNDRDTAIFDQRLCCDEDDAKTLREVGELFGISRERVRQLEDRLLVRLRLYLEAEGLGGTGR